MMRSNSGMCALLCLLLTACALACTFPISVSLSPTSATVGTTAVRQFTATLTGNPMSSTAVTWNVNSIAGGNSTVGTVSISGLYTAPSSVPTPATVSVTAVSVADPSKSATASVTIAAAAAPTVSSVSPSSGPLAGGTSVRITGSNFRAGPTVNFGSNAATSVVVVNSTTITCVSPAGSGAVTVTVINSDATSGSLSSGFAYGTTGGAAIITAAQFGNHEHSTLTNGWPQIPVGTIRTWDSVNPKVNWKDNEKFCNGTYDWTGLDSLVTTALSHGVDIIYTFGHYANQGLAGCSGATLYPATETSPPPDSPTDSKWAAYVTAITTRYAGKIKYWEISNEPNSGTQFFSGTTAQLVAMAAVAYPIIKASDPGAVVLTPSPQGPSVGTWFTGYFTAGGDAYADIVAFHGYMNPSHLNTLESTYGSEISGVKSAMVGTSLATAKIWDTEHGWGVDNPTTYPGSQTINTDDQDVQASFVARHELLGFAKGIERLIWYAWSDDTHGTLYNKRSSSVLFGTCQPHTECKGGVAYQQIYNWLHLSTYPSCSSLGTQWTCTLILTSGTAAEVLWDTSFACSSGSCTTHPVTVGLSFNSYKDLAGNTFSIAHHQVPVGLKPILVL